MNLVMDIDEWSVLECWEGERHETVFSRGSAMFSGTVSANSLNLGLRKAIEAAIFTASKGFNSIGAHVVDLQCDGRLQNCP